MRKWLLTLPLLLIITFYLVLPSLAQSLTRSLLAEQGVTTPHIDIQHPGWNTLFIPAAEFQRSKDGMEIRVRTENISIVYSPAALFFDQRLESITFDTLSAEIRLSPTPAAAPPTAATLGLAALLPEQIVQQAPLDSIAINALQITVHPQQQPALRITGNAEINARGLTYQSRLRIGDGDSEELPLQLTVSNTNQLALTLGSPDQPLLASRTTLTLDSQTSTAAQQLKVEGEHRLNLTALTRLLQQPALQKYAAFTPAMPALSGQLQLSGFSMIPAQLPTTELYRYLVNDQQLSAELSLQRPSPEVAGISVAINARLQQQAEHLRLDLQQADAQLHGLQTGTADGRISSPRLNLTLAPATWTADLPTLLQAFSTETLPELALPALKLTVNGAPITLQTPDAPLEISYATTTVTLQNLALPPLSATGSIQTGEIRTRLPAQALPPVTLHSQFTLSPQQLDNHFTLRLLERRLPDGALIIHGNSATKLATDSSPAHTTARWKLQSVALAGIEKSLKPYLPALPDTLAITAGELHHRGWLDLNQHGPALRLLQEVRGLNGSHGETRLLGVNWQSETLRSHRGRLTDSGTLRIDFIDLGIPLEALSSQYRYTQPGGRTAELALDSSRVDLLGGTLTTLPVRFNPTAPELNTAIALTHIDLARVIALEQQPGLSGEGTLNGQFPVQVHDGQLRVTDGQLNSTPSGGWIRFTPAPEVLALSQANPSLNIALDALRNLQYSSLGIKLDYSPDGTANLQTRLQGNNPDWNRGQPIDLTINIEENIPQLMKTLQFTDELTRKIEKRYR